LFRRQTRALLRVDGLMMLRYDKEGADDRQNRKKDCVFSHWGSFDNGSWLHRLRRL